MGRQTTSQLLLNLWLKHWLYMRGLYKQMDVEPDYSACLYKKNIGNDHLASWLVFYNYS